MPPDPFAGSTPFAGSAANPADAPLTSSLDSPLGKTASADKKKKSKVGTSIGLLVLWLLLAILGLSFLTWGINNYEEDDDGDDGLIPVPTRSPPSSPPTSSERFTSNAR